MNRQLRTFIPDDKLSLGEKIKSLRKYHDISREDLANRMGITYSYLAKLENGDKDNPSDEVIEKLGKELKINPEFFRIKENVIPQDFFKDLPKDILELLLSKEFLPYLTFTKQAISQGVTVEQYEAALEIIKRVTKDNK